MHDPPCLKVHCFRQSFAASPLRGWKEDLFFLPRQSLADWARETGLSHLRL